MNKPLVSIIMPAYNAEKYLRDAVQSVIDQSVQNWELFIINDGSTDDTASVAQECVLQDARVKLISQENKKQGAARNAGIKRSSGDWIAFLDADDLWTPDKLEKQLKAASLQPTADVFFSRGYIFSEEVKRTTEYSTISGFFDAKEMYRLEYEGNYVPVLSVLLKASFVAKIGLQDESRYIQGCEDWDYWLRLAKSGACFYGMDEYLFYYRRHATNVSNDDHKMRLAKATAFVKNLDKNRLSSSQLAKAVSFINITICTFIKKGRTGEAMYLNQQLSGVLKEPFRDLSGYLINALGTKSYYPVRFIYKISSSLPASTN